MAFARALVALARRRALFRDGSSLAAVAPTAEGVPAFTANGQSPILYSKCADDTSPRPQTPKIRPSNSQNENADAPRESCPHPRRLHRVRLESLQSPRRFTRPSILLRLHLGQPRSPTSSRPEAIDALMEMTTLAAPQTSSIHFRRLAPDTMAAPLQVQMPPSLAQGVGVRSSMRTPMLGQYSRQRLPAHSQQQVGLRSFSTGPPLLYSAFAPPSPPSSSHSSTSSSPIDNAAAPAVTYRVAAGGSGKSKSFSPERDIFGVTDYGRKRGRVETGQDSFFMAPLGVMDINTGGLAIGVADGVGGYMESGIDSADFSHEFCEHMARMAMGSSPSTLHARALMARGYNRVQEDGHVRGGASTACVGIARPDGQLEVANLGDSGYIVFRLGKICYESEPQTHAFNTPYQLSIIPPELLAQARAYGGVPLGDSPRQANVKAHLLEPGDVVIFATDGVFDNMFSHQILQIVGEEMVNARCWVKDKTSRYRAAEGNGDCVERKIVERVVRAAKKLGADPHTDGPFAKEVHRYYPTERYSGGKPDDVGVVCLVVDKGKL